MKKSVLLNNIFLEDELYEINENIILERPRDGLKDIGSFLSVINDDPELSSVFNAHMFFLSLRLALPQINIKVTIINKEGKDLFNYVFEEWNTTLSNYYPRASIIAKESPSKVLVLNKREVSRIIDVHNLIVKNLYDSNRPNYTRWEYALNEYFNCTASSRLESSIINIISGLESLLVRDEGQLTFKVALYSSLLVSEDPAQRKRTFNLVKKMYNLRSKSVHGDIKGLVKIISSPDIYELYFELKEILSIILIKATLFEEAELDSILLESIWKSPYPDYQK